MYDYSAVSYNRMLYHLKFWQTHTGNNSCIKGKNIIRQTEMNWLSYEANIVGIVTEW